jgi:hypothetical protein
MPENDEPPCILGGFGMYVSLFYRTSTAALLLLLPLAGSDDKTVVPLRHAHAHNDYEHERPLFDALDHGFCSVEADVFLVEGKLLVGHSRSALRPERSLESLYLDPLRERIKANDGRVYRGGPPVFLLIDIKTVDEPTCDAIDTVLARYADMMSAVRNGKLEEKAITAVASGFNDKPSREKMLQRLTGQSVRYIGLDGRLDDLDSTAPAHLMPWISDRWGNRFSWRGEGPMPEEQRKKLRDYVARAHDHGRLLRFWATPEEPAFWRQLRAAGVDLINTDKLAELEKFLRQDR